LDFFDKFSQNILGDHKKRIIKKEFDNNVDDFNEEILSDDREKRKFIPLYVLAFFIFGVLIFKLWSLQIAEGAHYKYLSEGNHIRNIAIPSSRGVIYTKDGFQLVSNTPSFILEVTPQDLPSDKTARSDLLKQVSLITGMSYNDIVDKTKNVASEPTILIDNLSRDNALILKEKMANFQGFAVIDSASRQYNGDQTFSHILGYVGKISQDQFNKLKNQNYSLLDYIGKTGLESYYENILKGQNGEKQVEVDATGKISKILAQKDPVAGNNLVLTIDSGLQNEMSQVLSQALSSAKSPGGAAVALDPNTGAVLGMVSLPTYNNNIFTNTSDPNFQKEYQALINDPKKPLYNRAIAGVYPPGSTIKMLMATAGLQEKEITVNTYLNAPGEIDIPNKYDPSIIYRFPDWKPGGQGYINVIGAIAQSCDVFFYAVGGGWQNISGLGIDKMYQYFVKFGLGSKTGIDLPSENAGLAPNAQWKLASQKQPWSLGDTYHASIGQGDLLVTPIQLANYVATIANGGTLMKPHVVWKVQDGSGKVVQEFDKEVTTQQVADPANINIVRQGMQAAVTSGTARILQDLPVSSGGKTGTAQFDNNASAHAWFASFAPYDNPQIALVVLVEGGGEGYAVAAPVANQILQYYFSKK
jgi:penicillin-binding protein 2